MDLIKIITELRRERDAISQAMAYLEQVSLAQGVKRRGRPPAYLTQSSPTQGSSSPGSTQRQAIRKPFSEATKRKMAASQKKRWDAYRQSQEAHA